MRNAARRGGIALFGLMLVAGSAAADPLNIRIGWATTPTHIQPLIDALQKAHPELFHHFGQSYVAEGLRFDGSTPQIQAIAINELEIAAFGPSAVALAVNNAHLDLKIVGDVFQDGKPGYTTVRYVVLGDGPIHQIEDLKGGRVGTNAIGSFGDSTMRVMLRKHGLRDSDVTTIQMNFANMPAMLMEGKVDLINLMPQFNDYLTTGKARLLFTGADAQGVSQAQVWAMRADFIAAHRPALVDFFEDHIRALHWFLDPAHHDAAVDIAQAVTKMHREDVAYVFTHDDSYRSPDALPDVSATQQAINHDLELGVIPKGITVVPAYLDLSLAADAKARIDKESAAR
jgi:NitT/TauT family transport system substrate-binding protein